MYELIPLGTGVAAGVAALQLSSWFLRAVLIGLASLAAAFVAGTLSGELSESWAFLLWDGFQGVVAAVLVLVVGPRLVARTRSAR